MKTIGKFAFLALLVFGLLQLFRPSIPTSPATVEVLVPTPVKRILEKDCYSCHSNRTRLSWFDEIAPGYWVVRHDILTARQHLNFSTLGAKSEAEQRATLYEAVNMIQLGAMPLPEFRRFHPEAKVTPEELATLKAYLAPWRSTPGVAAPTANEPWNNVSLQDVRPDSNGRVFDPTFENWKLMSTTDRGDSYTLRLILGNATAFNAVQTGDISPWPDGSRLAKIAWKQELGSDGLIHPGKLVHVALMVKDARHHKATEGWDWGQWQGLALEPYGTDASFVSKCTTCHRPMKGNDYVYTQPFTEATVAGQESVNNSPTELPAGIPFQPLAWGVITLYVDPATHTTATLFGNDEAIRSVREWNQLKNKPSVPTYLTGAVLALVTWTQRDDPHWFGARIPDVVRSVESIRMSAPGHANEYRRFAGTRFTEQSTSGNEAEQRGRFIQNLPPASLP